MIVVIIFLIIDSSERVCKMKSLFLIASYCGHRSIDCYKVITCQRLVMSTIIAQSCLLYSSSVVFKYVFKFKIRVEEYFISSITVHLR